MMEYLGWLLFLMSLLYTTTNSNSVDRNCNQLYEGWTIMENECTFREDIDNCQNPTMFNSLEDCQLELYGLVNYCSLPDVCRNNGFCVSTRTWYGSPAYKCYCDGTGYYGKKCETRCPSARTFPRPRSFPVSCIQI
ncbi:uncharacterized protein LOC143043200 [Mytilus galloprovincialis]|uniref:uncharacterized protein LOC143043200 n=1 Tax=Mytilus galloprovincialis TaxID=29158 RepID=UPI003F7BC80B